MLCPLFPLFYVVFAVEVYSLNDLLQTLFQLTNYMVKREWLEFTSADSCVCEREVYCVVGNVVYNDGLWFQQNRMTLRGLRGWRRKQKGL
jgi:hypothetical protein